MKDQMNWNLKNSERDESRENWTRQNHIVFNEEMPNEEQNYRGTIKFHEEITEAFNSTYITNSSQSKQTKIWVGWSPPPIEWIKLNIDGSLKHNTRMAGEG